MKRAHSMPFGAEVRGDGTTRFRLWAPSAEGVVLELESPGEPRRLPMQARAGGWHETVTAHAPAGTRYRFRLPANLAVPDPAARASPLGVHGPSEVVDPRAHAWSDSGWRGRPWHEAVLYELHVGTFTPEGSFAAAAARLPELAALGITAVELMPLASFPGKRGWGYDGVLPFAPEPAYGTPAELKSLIESAHALRLMVLLDVVYNHFGPEGNYLHAYCPEFFNPAHQTPWGAAINFDGVMNREVRAFFVHNALYWVEEYGFDGLRLDAVHAIRDESAEHIVGEISRALAAGPGRARQVHLVLENGDNAAHFLERGPDLAPRIATAQWNDDVHHAIHVIATGETDGYYVDFASSPIEGLGRALAEGFIFQGQASPFHGGGLRGEPSAHLPGAAFVSFLQSHDQVGNRAFGERIHALGDTRLLAAAACLRAAVAARADAVHGRGVGRNDAVPVFLRLRVRTGGCGARWPARRVRALRCVPGPGGARAHSRPQCGPELPRLEARSSRARAGAACGASRAHRCVAGAAARISGSAPRRPATGRPLPL